MWAWKRGSGEFTPYDPDISARIEGAHAVGDKGVIIHLPAAYRIDFGNMCQINLGDASKRRSIVRLNAFVCTKLHPPKYAEAVENFDFLVTEQPGDLTAYLQRACCLMALQVTPFLLQKQKRPSDPASPRCRSGTRRSPTTRSCWSTSRTSRTWCACVRGRTPAAACGTR